MLFSCFPLRFFVLLFLVFAYDDSLTTLCSQLLIVTTICCNLCRQHVPFTTYLANIIIILLHSFHTQQGLLNSFTSLYSVVCVFKQPLKGITATRTTAATKTSSSKPIMTEGRNESNRKDMKMRRNESSFWQPFLCSVLDFYSNSKFIYNIFWNFPSETDIDIFVSLFTHHLCSFPFVNISLIDMLDIDFCGLYLRRNDLYQLGICGKE